MKTTASWQKLGSAIAIAVAVAMLGLFYHTSQPAKAGNVQLPPVGDIVTDWSAVGSSDGSCVDELCDRVDDDFNNPDTSTYISSTSGGNVVRFAMDEFDIERVATQLTVRLHARNVSADSTLDDIDIDVLMPGGNTSVQSVTPEESSSFSNYSVSWSGSYTQNDIDNMEVRLEQIMNRCGLCVVGGHDELNVAALTIEVDYEDYATLRQSSFRFYQNQDDIAPGSPLGDTDEAAEVANNGAAFRIRMTQLVETNNYLAAESDYKLQYGEKVIDCQAATYADVGASSTIQYYQNPSVSDGTSINATAEDPNVSGSITYQTYAESNPAVSTSDAPESDYLLWDFALAVDSAALPGTSYCLRMVYEGGDELAQYDTYPELLVTGDLQVAIVDAESEIVTNPAFSMSIATVLSECQNSTGHLGEAGQILRITNDVATQGWGVSIAATEGSNALWSDDNGAYDFNDPAGSPAGCAAGTDADTYAGLLTIDPTASTITPDTGCSSTGLMAGSEASFEEGVIDSIQLLTATGSSERFCDFYVEGIDLIQTIPAYQPSGTYSLDMTITIVAS